MQAICFFDIDNTLVPFGQNDIRKEEKDVLDKLKENGHYVFINSGRSLAFTPKYILDYPFSGYALGCGTYLEIDHKLISYFEFDSSLCKSITEDVQKYNLSVVFEGHHGHAFYTTTSHPIVTKLYQSCITQNTPMFDITDANYKYSKFCIFQTNAENENAFIQKYQNQLDFIQRSENFFEVVPKGYSKGEAVIQIAKYLNIPLENCWCFGDSTNDLSMLQVVKHPVVMGNGDEEVKKVAEFITHDCKDDGIEFACKHYNLI